MQHRVRGGHGFRPGPMLAGIIVADEVYMDGKPRKTNECDDDKESNRGRETDKASVIGAVQRDGNMILDCAGCRRPDRLGYWFCHGFCVTDCFIDDDNPVDSGRPVSEGPCPPYLGPLLPDYRLVGYGVGDPETNSGKVDTL